MSFFEVNLDYVYFLAGLSAMGLGAAASLLVIERDRSMRWIMLAAFGILAGLAAWAATASIGLGDAPVFAWTRFAVRTAAFAALFEFGRASLAPHRRVPGAWMTGALAAGALASAALGINAAEAISRLGLGLPAAMAAAWAFADTSSRLTSGVPGIARRARRMLGWLVVSMAAYAACLVPAGDGLVISGHATSWSGRSRSRG
jgi:hypothetical protein